MSNRCAINKNRLSICTIIGDKQLQKKELGYFKQCTSSQKISGTFVVGLNDSMVVYIDLNCVSFKPETFVRLYNMSLVDRMDQNMAKFRIAIQTRKWWWVPFAWLVDVFP